MKKVIIALSGGIDSSVSAALFKRAGFDLTGVFMRLNGFDDGKRAKKVASELDIPFLVLDLRKEFKKTIIDYFLKEYREGRTPNPCVLCNKEIKFKFLIKKALELKADYVATGHYARVKDGRLYMGKDKEKDQSYFLWKLNYELKKIIFSVSPYTKTYVKELALKFNLKSYDKKESQEVCFIKSTTFDYLKKELGEKRGDIINEKGEKIGEHQGLWFYTIGQRKGIGLSSGPFYVVDKDIKNNALVVSKKRKAQKEVRFIQANFIRSFSFPQRCKVKTRYKSDFSYGTLFKSKFIFDSPKEDITKGQSIVFYKGKEVIGGGVIK